MLNSSQLMDFQNKRKIIMESVDEAFNSLSFINRSPNLFWIIFLIFIGWMLSLVTLKLTGNFRVLQQRALSRVIFFAAFHEKIRRVFRCQDEESLQTLVTGSYRVLWRNTEEPTVFLVLVPRDASGAATRLVTLLVHCVLVALQRRADQHYITSLFIDGNKYSSHNDEWPFFKSTRIKMKTDGVAAVFAFESLHPQVVKTLKLLTSLVYSPFPKSMLILVADVRNRFTEHQKKTMTPNKIGKIFLQEQLGPYVEHNELLEIINQIGSRCILVNPEGRRKDSVIY